MRNLHLCEYYGARLHLCHVSTKGGGGRHWPGQAPGVPATCEVTPHHLWFAGTEYREPAHPGGGGRGRFVEAIRDGTVDAIATDHAPHSDEDKAKGAAGMVGLETAFAVCCTKLCRQEGLELYYLSALMSRFPAAILGLAGKGRVEVGADADLTLVELDTPFTVDREALH